MVYLYKYKFRLFDGSYSIWHNLFIWYSLSQIIQRREIFTKNPKNKETLSIRLSNINILYLSVSGFQIPSSLPSRFLSWWIVADFCWMENESFIYVDIVETYKIINVNFWLDFPKNGKPIFCYLCDKGGEGVKK